ncbi:hypothetical protein ACIO3S_18660 [Nocardioides sp. NPDC087217]|uniref:hypothetical protein n=1 Tax=Nocardioides sp. NPDC087217 TaxID=3364335 RepID=UPI00380B37B9
MTRVGVLVVALLMSLGGCAEDSPYGEFGPSGSASAPEARFDAEVRVRDNEVQVAYRFANDGDEPLLLINRPGVAAGAGVRYREEAAYVTEDADGGALLSQALFGFPDTDQTWASIPRDVDEVRFCLGVVTPPFPESMTPRTEEDGTRIVGHASAKQHLYCSESAAVG